MHDDERPAPAEGEIHLGRARQGPAQRFAIKRFVAMKEIDDVAREAEHQHALVGGEAVGEDEIGPRGLKVKMDRQASLA